MDHLLSVDQIAIRDAARDVSLGLVAPRASSIDETAEFPADLFRELGRLGYLGMSAPHRYGGGQFDLVSTCLALEELSYASGAVGSSVNAHIGLATTVLAHSGTDRQKDHYLPRMASGEWLGAFGLTEPSGGTDAGHPQTRAARTDAGWALDGGKCFITNGTVADVFVVTARAPRGVSAFVLGRDTPGFARAADDRKVGMRGSPTCNLFFDDARLPPDSLIGEEGSGFRAFATVLDRGRVQVAALSVGLARAAFDLATSYAKERRQFGRAIGGFQAISLQIAEMAAEIEAARLMTWNAARLHDLGLPFKRQAALAKYVAAAAGEAVASRTIEILGGYGYLRDFAAQRFWRDVKMYQIGEGTSQVQRLVAAREILGSDVVSIGG